MAHANCVELKQLLLCASSLQRRILHDIGHIAPRHRRTHQLPHPGRHHRSPHQPHSNLDMESGASVFQLVRNDRRAGRHAICHQIVLFDHQLPALRTRRWPARQALLPVNAPHHSIRAILFDFLRNASTENQCVNNRLIAMSVDVE